MHRIIAGVFLAALLSTPASAGQSPWSAVSMSVGGQGRWLDQGQATAHQDFEAVGNGAISLTPHVSITGGAAYGFRKVGSYVRGQVDARITATDVTDPNFNVWVGAGQYFSQSEDEGLNEGAGKAGVGWRPFAGKPYVVGLTAAYGFDTGRRSLSAAVLYAFKITKGAK